MPNQKKKLYRSNEDRIIAGVCGGLGDYFKIDPILIRGVFILLALIDGVGLLLYLILLIVTPKEPGAKAEIKREEKVKELAQGLKGKAESLADEFKEEFKDKKWYSDKKSFIGIIIVIIGLALLLDQLIPFRLMRWNLLWPTAVILVGLYIVFKKRGE